MRRLFTHKIKRRIIALAGISVISMVLLEIALRIGGFYYTYTEKMDGKYVSYYNDTMPTWYYGHGPYDSLIDIKPEYTYRSRANNMGFRDGDFDTTNDKHVMKILVLGDSFVQGIGTSIDSTWPHLFESLLNKRQDCKYRVYNCGAVGDDPLYEYVMLRDKLIKLHPDVVIMSINYSDVNDYITRGGMERFRPEGITVYNKGPWFEPLYKRLHVVRLFVHFILRYDFSLLSPAGHDRALTRALDGISSCAESAQALCTSSNIRFLAVLHPYIDPYDRYLKKQVQLPQIEEILRDKHIEVANLFGDFAAVITESNYKTYSWPRDMHYTSRGYDLFAHLLYDKVSKEYPDMLTAKCRK